MEVDDRSPIAEHFIYQLWEKNYFSSIPLKTIDEMDVSIISPGIRNEDEGPDFKDAVIKIDEKIYHGDVEIHRATEDWYVHGHHANPAYNNVIFHLVIGEPIKGEPAIRLDRKEVPAQVFINITENKFFTLAKKYKLTFPGYTAISACKLSEKSNEEKIAIIDYFGRERLIAKAERFKEQHQSSSWDQVLYLGIMEALGYSKNQIPFRKLANLLPVEALMREVRGLTKVDALVKLQGIMMGTAGLLPSQDPSFDWRRVKDENSKSYVERLEQVWQEFYSRLGIKPMERSEWLFFRLRPSNFPTRRLVGAGMILQRFFEKGILKKILTIVQAFPDENQKVVREIEKCFICKARGYWANHYRFEEGIAELETENSVTLIGQNRAREIVINILLPVLYAFAEMSEDSRLKIKITRIFQVYPKTVTNSIIDRMTKILLAEGKETRKLINSASRQQGMIHLYKLYCRRKECARCQKEWENID